MRRRICVVCLLVALPTVSWGAPKTGTKTEGPDPGAPTNFKFFRFADWPLPGWQMVRDQRSGYAGQFVKNDGGMVNYIAPGTERMDPGATNAGVGAATAVVADLRVADFTAIAHLSFERHGTPSVLLRVLLRQPPLGSTNEAPVLSSMLCLVLNVSGVVLWAFDSTQWTKLAESKSRLDAQKFYTLKAVLVGPKVTVFLENKQVCEATNVAIRAPGTVGIWATDGPCSFRSLSVRYAKNTTTQ